MQSGRLIPSGSGAGSATLVQILGLTSVPRLLLQQIQSGPKMDSRGTFQLD